MILTQLNTILKKDLLIFLILVACSLVLFSSGIQSKAVGFHQSDLFIALSSKLGVLPSPGYPLLSSLIFMMTTLLGPALGFAFSSHLLSAILASLTVGFVYLTCVQMYDYLGTNKNYLLFSVPVERTFLAVLAASLLMISRLFWRYSFFIERYTLSTLLVSVILFLFFRIFLLTKKALSAKDLLPLCIALGLGISHQWIFIPITLTVIYLLKDQLLKVNKQALGLALLCVIAAAIGPYLLLLYGFNDQVAFSVIFERTFAGLKEYVLFNYLGDALALSGNINQLVQFIDLESVIANLWEILQILGRSFGWLIMIPLVAILFYHPSPKKKHLAKELGLLLGVVLVSLALVFIWNQNLEAYPEILPQILILHPLIALISFFGFYELLTRFGGFVGVLTTNYKSQYIIFAALALLPLYLGYSHFREVDLTSYPLADEVAQTVLNQVEPNSLVTCFSYSSCYALIYEQQVNHNNPEVAVMPFYYLPGQIRLPFSNLQKFSYTNYPNVMYDIITWNKELIPVYSVDMFEEYFEILGINYGFMNYIPYGYYSQLTDQIPESYPEVDLDISRTLLATDIPSWDFALQKAKYEMAKRHLFNTSIYMKSGLRDIAVNEVNIATTLGYDLDPRMAAEIAEVRSHLESIFPSDFFDLGFEAANVEYILGEVDKLVEAQLPGKAQEIARGAVTVDPVSVPARLKYAELMEINQASESAILEYNHVLQIDPDNQQAKDRLEYQASL